MLYLLDPEPRTLNAEPFIAMPSRPYRHILVLADIEGSSGCGSYRASSFLTHPWASACMAMAKDVDAVVRALFTAGVPEVTVKDFHRTAYNLLPERIDGRARIVCGYRRGPVPGLGTPGGADAVMMLGMHAAAGTNGFLAHTLTSRLAALEVNGRPLAEVELFAASLAPYGIPAIFFSGCPEACSQARERIPGIQTLSIDKSVSPDRLKKRHWRGQLAQAAVQALANDTVSPYLPEGPFRAEITVRDGPAAASKMADPWGYPRSGSRVLIEAPDIHALYNRLIRLCYLPPKVEKTLPFGLMFYNAIGWLGRQWVRWQLRALSRR